MIRDEVEDPDRNMALLQRDIPEALGPIGTLEQQLRDEPIRR